MDSIAPFLEELFKHIGEIIVFLILAIASAFLGKLQTWWKDRPVKRFESGINKNIRVRELLSELRALYGADRVGLWQFKNGSFYVSGESIMRCSLTHYVTKTGIASPSLFGDIYTTHMLPTLQAIQEKCVAQFEHNHISDDSFQEALFTATGTGTVLLAAVRDARKNWIGILVVAFMEEADKALAQKSIRSYSQQIGEFLP